MPYRRECGHENRGQRPQPSVGPCPDLRGLLAVGARVDGRQGRWPCEIAINAWWSSSVRRKDEAGRLSAGPSEGVVDGVEARSSVPRGAGPQRRSGTGSWRPALVGAMAFWAAQLVRSAGRPWRRLTGRPCRSSTFRCSWRRPWVAWSVSSAVSVAPLRLRRPVPGIGVMRQALALSAIALLLLTLVVEVPSKLRSGVADPGHWLIVASMFNVVRILALGVAVGLVIRPGHARPPSRPSHPMRER